MATTPNPRREPLRPRSSNAPAALAPAPARRGPASAEKENVGNEEEKGKGKAKTAAAAAAATDEPSKTARPAPAVAPPPPPLKPSSLQLRMKDESAEAPVLMGPRGRELLPPPSSSYEAWDLSDSESAPASSWATLPNRYAAPPRRSLRRRRGARSS